MLGCKGITLEIAQGLLLLYINWARHLSFQNHLRTDSQLKEVWFFKIIFPEKKSSEPVTWIFAFKLIQEHKVNF